MKSALTSLAAAGALASAAALAQDAPTAPPASAVEPDAPVDAAQARETATMLAGILEETYVFPDVAKRYADALRARAAAGGYDSLGSAGALADRLTADLRAVAPDNHLRVMRGRPGDGPMVRIVRAPAGAAPPPGAGPQPRRMRMPAGPPIEEARQLAPGIAYVRFNLFPGDPETVEAARRFMADNAGAKTIIFDIRTHRGGGLAEMDAIFPYLFARPTTLVAMDTRASVDRHGGNPIGDGPSLRRVPTGEDVVRREHFVTPSATAKSLFGAKVFVLTSALSGSAAEHFALALKRTQRATLIGETTAGAGNYGGMRAIGDKFSAFVPVGRTFDPDTGKGWEGVGVAPDVAVPAERALAEALVRSGLDKAEAERIAAEVGPQGPMTRIVPRR